MHVFLSYSVKDKPLAERVRDTIKGAGATVFMAPESIEPGAQMTPTIRDEIERTDLVILIWSRNSNTSGWVQQEVGCAVGAKKTVLPVLVEKDVERPAFLADLQYVNAYEDLETGIEEVQRAIRQRVDARIAHEELEKIKGIVALGVLAVGAIVLWFTREK